MQSYRHNFQFEQVKYMLLNVIVNYDSDRQWQKLSNCSHQAFAQSHQKDLPTESAFFWYMFLKN